MSDKPKPRRGTWVEITDECNGADCDGCGECWTPEPARPVGGDTREALRESIIAALGAPYSATEWDVKKGYLDPEKVADAVLALPAVRVALDAQETVAVERERAIEPFVALAETTEATTTHPTSSPHVRCATSNGRTRSGSDTGRRRDE